MTNHEKLNDEDGLQNGKFMAIRVPMRLAKALERDAGNRLLTVSARCRQLLAEGVGYEARKK